jgi:ribose 5-phosphate isomerase B
MTIYLGADHRGVDFKKKIIGILEKAGTPYQDLGAYDSEQSCDYPLVAYKVAKEVAKHQNSRGILVCMSGIGQAIAANKVRGAYAALCTNATAARLSRQHNNANILVLGAKFIKATQLKAIILTWLKTEFEGGRHQRRVNQIKQIERKSC